MLKFGEVVDGKWEVLRSGGKGAFSHIYVVKPIASNALNTISEFIMKMSTATVDATVMKVETEVLKDIASAGVAPKLIASGTHNGAVDYVVMEHFSGDNMAVIRDKIRKNFDNKGFVPIPVAAYLAREMLRCIRGLHESGYTHRDIKPANFVRTSKGGSTFGIIDFGLAKKTSRSRRESAEFRGTSTYCSPHVHRGEDQSPRDDLYSMIFTFYDLIAGKLPWSQVSRDKLLKDKLAVAALKAPCLEKADYLNEWTSSCIRDHFMKVSNGISKSSSNSSNSSSSTINNMSSSGGVKGTIGLEGSLGSDDPAGPQYPAFSDAQQALCLDMMSLINQLDYDSIPDYNKLSSILTALMGPDPVDSPSYTSPRFSWAVLDELSSGREAKSDLFTENQSIGRSEAFRASRATLASNWSVIRTYCLKNESINSIVYQVITSNISSTASRPPSSEPHSPSCATDRITSDSLKMLYGSEDCEFGSNSVLGVENRYNLMRNIVNQLKLLGRSIVLRRDNSHTGLANVGLLGNLCLKGNDSTDASGAIASLSMLDLGVLWCNLFSILFTNVPLQFWSREAIDLLDATLTECAYFSTIEIADQFTDVWSAIQLCIFEFTSARNSINKKTAELFESRVSSGHSSSKRHRPSSTR